MKKLLFCAAVYIAGGFMTNAYCQVHRWDDWKVAKNWEGHDNEIGARQSLLAATLVWPAYWASRAALFVCEHKVEFSVVEPEGDE